MCMLYMCLYGVYVYGVCVCAHTQRHSVEILGQLSRVSSFLPPQVTGLPHKHPYSPNHLTSSQIIHGKPDTALLTCNPALQS